MDRQDNTHAPSGPVVEDDALQIDVAAVQSRLDDFCWAVVSFDKIEAGGMTYSQAEELMAALDTQGVAGLCIVTDEAAARAAS